MCVPVCAHECVCVSACGACRTHAGQARKRWGGRSGCGQASSAGWRRQMPTDCHPGGRNGELLRARALVPFRGSCIAWLDGKESSTKSRGNTYTATLVKMVKFLYLKSVFLRVFTQMVSFLRWGQGLWHLGQIAPGCGTVLCTVGCLPVSLASAH